MEREIKEIGTKDMNGKQIRHGDLIKYMGEDDRGALFIVQSHKGEYYYASLEDPEYNSPIWISPVEIIGNTFENPELLKEQ